LKDDGPVASHLRRIVIARSPRRRCPPESQPVADLRARRTSLVMAAFLLAGTTAFAQEAPPSFDVRSLNGVRVWSPKPAPKPPPPAVIERETIIVERPVPTPAEPLEPTVTFVPFPVYVPKPHRPTPGPPHPIRPPIVPGWRR
jgi:hypothetical protein